MTDKDIIPMETECPYEPVDGYMIVRPVETNQDTSVQVTRYQDVYKEGVILKVGVSQYTPHTTVRYLRDGVIKMDQWDIVPYTSIIVTVHRDNDGGE